MITEATVYNIALCLTPGIGQVSCRKLIAHFGTAENVFRSSLTDITATIGNSAAAAEIVQQTALERAKQEAEFCTRNGLQALFFTDPEYPQRMLEEGVDDAPVLLFVQGTADLNASHMVSVVGTRRSTAVGRENTAAIVAQLKSSDVTIVSGLAYGIDTAAHQAAIDNGMPTIAVLGHGLDRIYPPENRNLAAAIVAQGGALLTEYPSGTAINPRFFPARNRIIAAMSDTTIVAEASERGGALITAALATHFGREVFAMPGRISDPYSKGTNNLIANSQATILRSVDDILFRLGWATATHHAGAQEQQLSLFDEIPPDAAKLLNILQQNAQLTLDEVVQLSGMALPKVASLVFTMEMNKLVRALPGRLYQAFDR